MENRILFRVWSPGQRRWRTAYVRPEQRETNINAMVMLGFIVCTEGGKYYYDDSPSSSAGSASTDAAN